MSTIGNMTFADKLRWLCALQGLSQAELVRRLNDLGCEISTSTMGRWFSGRTLPDLAEGAALGKLFDVSVDLLAHDEIEIEDARKSHPSPLRPVSSRVRDLTGDARVVLREKSPGQPKRRRGSA